MQIMDSIFLVGEKSAFHSISLLGLEGERQQMPTDKLTWRQSAGRAATPDAAGFCSRSAK